MLKQTKILSSDDNDIKIAAQIIRNGGTVVFPTETVYGLGANALDENAVKKIFEAKGRPSDNPLIVHIDSFSEINKYVADIPENAKLLASAYWPGPMTLIMNKQKCIPDIVSAGLKTVGIRLPESKTARKFIEYSRLPIAAPSANLSGKPSTTKTEHVIKDMMGRVDAIIRGEDCEVGIESTVIDVTGEIPTILRPGRITPDMIKTVCHSVSIDRGINGVKGEEKPKSPGMKYKHYSPDCEIVLVEYSSNMLEKIKEERKKINEKKVAILCTKQLSENFSAEEVICIGDRNKPETIAHTLFEAFRKCDEMGFEVAIMEGLEESEIGFAVMNRAKRASRTIE